VAWGAVRPIRKRGRDVQHFSFRAKALDKYFLLLHSDFPRHHGKLLPA
jgi:hypothetical protein